MPGMSARAGKVPQTTLTLTRHICKPLCLGGKQLGRSAARPVSRECCLVPTPPIPHGEKPRSGFLILPPVPSWIAGANEAERRAAFLFVVDMMP